MYVTVSYNSSILVMTLVQVILIPTKNQQMMTSVALMMTAKKNKTFVTATSVADYPHKMAVIEYQALSDTCYALQITSSQFLAHTVLLS